MKIVIIKINLRKKIGKKPISKSQKEKYMLKKKHSYSKFSTV